MRIFVLTLLIAVGCSSTSKHDEARSSDSYRDPGEQSVIDAHTKFFRKYDGLYEIFRGHATLMTPDVQEAVLQKRGDFLKWETKKLQDEKDKARQEMATQTTVFLQFYTPDVDYNDLNRYNTIWHAYLDVSGRRFEGKVRKARGKLIEFQAIYPNYDRFSIAYELTFDISTADAARSDTKLVLASTLGEGDFIFPAAH